MQTHMCRPTIRRSLFGLSALFAVAMGAMIFASEAQAQVKLDLPNPFSKPWNIGKHNGSPIIGINANVPITGIFGNNNGFGQNFGPGSANGQGGGNMTMFPQAPPFFNPSGPFQNQPAPFFPQQPQFPPTFNQGSFFNQGPMIGSPGGASAISVGGSATAIGGNNQVFFPY